MVDSKAKWSVIHDNETDRDLLNYQPIVETIKEVILNSGEEPITVGIHGDWGAGKSSVLKMLEISFEDEDGLLCVTFNGWLYQEFEDAKIALLEKLLSSIEGDDELDSGIKKKAIKLFKRVDWLKAGKLALKYGAPVASTLLTGIPFPFVLSGLPKAEGQNEEGKGTEKLTKYYEDACSAFKPPDDKIQVTTQIENFRKEFAELLSEARIKRLVVLVDDLDRCLPATTVETLEAIRLFLFIPKASFVIAADQSMIEYSVSQHYPQISNMRGVATQASDYSKNYLEKLVQVPFVLPSLGRLATKVYVLLLMLQSVGATGSDKLDKLKGVLHDKLKIPWEANTIDFEVINEVLEASQDNTDRIKECLFVADQIFVLLAEATKGNPRQVKRFINTLLLYLQIAKAMGLSEIVSIKPMAKLMLLERFKQNEWGKLALECMSHPDGRSRLIRSLEEGPPDKAGVDGKRGEEIIGSTIEPTTESAKQSKEDPWLQSWAKLEPMLSDIDLRPYFLVAKDVRLPVFAKTVSPKIAKLARRLMAGEMEATRAKGDLENLNPDEFTDLFETLKSESQSAASLGDEPPAIRGLALLVKAKHEYFQPYAGLLDDFPLERVGSWLAGALLKACPTPAPPDALRIMQKWAEQEANKRLNRSAKAYLKQLQKSDGR